MLADQQRCTWDKIVKDQTESALYVDLHGETFNEAAGKTRESFGECVTFHLLTEFTFSAGDKLSEYITGCLKKPNRDLKSIRSSQE